MSKTKAYLAIAAGFAIIAVLAAGSGTLSAAVRAALVQDVSLLGFQPFQLSCNNNITAAPATRVSCTTTAVPAGKRFVIEHISGQFGAKLDNQVDAIFISGPGIVYLPTHLESRPLNFGGVFGVGRLHQYGSPVKWHVASGGTLSASGDSNVAGTISMSALGFLVDE